MGNQESQEQTSMVVPLQQTQYTVVESRREWELWEDRISGRRYMVFLPNEKILNDHDIQVYHFRKLNRVYLSGVHSIAQDSQGICGTPTRTLLFLDHLPFTLADFRRRLTIQEGLTVLQAALSGYRIMCYLFGPLNCSPDMVWFTEGGVPKVWANQQLNINQPSQSALERERSEFGSNVSITDRKVISISSIFSSVSTALVHPFPLDFQREMEGTRSYEQAEEMVELFCRREDIELQEWIDTRQISQKRLLFYRNSSQSMRKQANDSPKSEYYQQYHFQEPTLTAPVSITHRIPQNKPFIHHRARQLVHPAARPHPIFIQSFHHPQHPLIVAPQAVQTQTIITSYPFQSQRNTQQELKPQPSLKTVKVSVDQRLTLPIAQASPIGNQLYLINAQAFENEIQTRQQISSSQISQSSHEQHSSTEQNYQLVIHEINDNSLSHIQQPILDKTIQMEEAVSNHVSTPLYQNQKPEIELWEQSLQKIAQKMITGQSSQCYRSEERDHVVLSDIQQRPQKEKIPQKSDEQLEKYIRSKYSDYFTDKYSPQKDRNSHAHHHTSSLDRQLFEKRVAFADVAEKDYDQDVAKIGTGKFITKPTFSSFKKYTFGSIELQPSNPTKEYQDHQQASWISRQSSQEVPSGHRKRPKQDTLNQKYSKYVINRSSKHQPHAAASNFGKQQKGNTYDQLRRLLWQ